MQILTSSSFNLGVRGSVHDVTLTSKSNTWKTSLRQDPYLAFPMSILMNFAAP